MTMNNQIRCLSYIAYSCCSFVLHSKKNTHPTSTLQQINSISSNLPNRRTKTSLPSPLYSTTLSSTMSSWLDLHPITSSISLVLCYMLIANFIYIARRAHLREMSKYELLRIRTTREPNTSLRLYITTVFVWQCFVAVFPIVECWARFLCPDISTMIQKCTPKLRPHVSFFYSYPNAHGCGIILEPLDIQKSITTQRGLRAISISKRTKQQIRLDWHRFQVNVGEIGRDGFKHPPTKQYNLPHVDIPCVGYKHWPWRRRYLTK